MPLPIHHFNVTPDGTTVRVILGPMPADDHLCAPTLAKALFLMRAQLELQVKIREDQLTEAHYELERYNTAQYNANLASD